MSVLTVSNNRPLAEYDHRVSEHWLDGKHGPIRYWESAVKRGLPLLLIHGYGGLIEHWQRVIPLLAAVHTPYAFDLYNFGYSALLDIPPTKHIWAAQAAQIINTVIKQPAVVIGHSMGGIAAAQLAHDYPHLVRGLVLVNSMGLPPDQAPTTFERALFGLIRSPLLGDILAGVMTSSWAVRQSLIPAYHDRERVTPEMVEMFHGPLRQPGRARGYLAVSRSFRDLVLDVEPGDVQAPTLIVWGAEDRAMPVQRANDLQQRLFPHADIRFMPATGHCPFDEAPEQFSAILLPWLEKFVQTPIK